MTTCAPAPTCGSGIPRGAQGDTFPRDCGSRWYCVWLKYTRQAEGIIQLRNQGLEVSQPLRMLPGGKLDPLFDAYCFVRFDVEQDNWQAIGNTRGVRKLFNPQQPIPLPQPFVAAYLATSNLVIDCRPGKLEVGQFGRITSGAFFDMVGICLESSATRVRLLMEVLAGQVEVTVPSGIVEVKP